MRARIVLLLIALVTGAAGPPPERVALLRRGVNVTNWFRYPPSAAPGALDAYLSDAAIATLRGAGFTFVRLPVAPALVPERLASVRRAVARLERAGLAVMVEAHDDAGGAGARARLLAFWAALAPALRGFDARLTFPEVMNEPVFANDPAGWEALQAEALAVIRASLPDATVVLTGNEWGGVDGLLRLRPAADANVVYSVHFYEPMEVTTFVRATRFDADAAAARIGAVGAWARAHGAVVVAGEFGISARQPASLRAAWLSTVRRAFEAQGIGWALWGLDDVHGFDLPRPPPANPALDPAVLDALGLARVGR
jgi:hypothetical protein